MATHMGAPGERNILSQSRPRLQRRLLLSSHAARTALPHARQPCQHAWRSAAAHGLDDSSRGMPRAARGPPASAYTRLSAGDDTQPIPSLIRTFLGSVMAA